MRLTYWASVLVVGFASAIACGDTTAAKSSPFSALGQPAAAEGPAANQSALHVDLGTDFENADFFRGVRLPVNSPAFQGYFDLYFQPIKSGDLTIGSYVGVRDGGAEKSRSGGVLTDYLQEIYVGGTVQWQAWSLDLGYVEHHAPDGSFATQDEIGARLDFDDSALMKTMNCPILLQPHVEIFQELIDQGAGVSFRSEPRSLNSYVEVGMAPQHRFKITDSGAWSLNVAAPVTVGMSWDNYFSLTPTAKSSFFGFVSAGVLGAISLPVPSTLGAWDVRGGVIWTNDTAQGARQVDHNHANFFTLGLGVAMHY